MSAIRALALAAAWILALATSACSSGSPDQPPPGRCAGVVCAAIDACHLAGACDEATGTCSQPPAPDGASCAGGTCSAGACLPTDRSACGDGLHSAGETGVDCGGTCPACPNGQACSGAADCLNGACRGGQCATAAAALTADAGPDLTVAGGAQVSLDGTRSLSPAGPVATWRWEQAAGPPVTLTGADTPRPGFLAPAVDAAGEALTFTLTVGDGAGAAASVDLLVEVRQPAALPTPTTGAGLTRRALAEGRLDRDTAAQYLAFSVYGDPRLPAAYQGSERGPSGTGAMKLLAEEFPTLSPAAQQVVRPFLLPAIAPGSWYSLRQRPPPGAAGAQAAAAAPAAPEWRWVVGAHVAVYYLSDLAGGLATATALRDEIEARVWPGLLAVWRADHLPILADALVPDADFHGVRGKLNLIITRGLAELGAEQSYFLAPSPSWIQVREGLPLTGKDPMGLYQVAAHEMTHSCQDSYAQAESYSQAQWLYDGIASWAEDDVYPDVDSEHPRAKYWLNRPDLSLDDDDPMHAYASYLFFQGVTRGLGTRDFVRRAFDNFQREKALAAVDHAFQLGIGFNFQWGPIMELAWNRDPASGFWAADGLELGARASEVPPTEVRMSGGELQVELEAAVQHLAARYHHLTLPDPTARQLFFYDGLTYPLIEFTDVDGSTFLIPDSTAGEDPLRFLDVATRLLELRDGSWQRPATSPAPGGLIACQDDPGARLDELMIAFGDSAPRKGHRLEPEGHLPRLWVSNIGCYRWQGTVTAVTSQAALPGPVERITAAVEFLRDPAFDMAGQPFFPLAHGQFTWEISGKVDDCTYAGQDAWSDGGLQAGALSFSPQVISGRLHRAYTGGGSGHQASYTLTCVDPEGRTTVTSHTTTVTWLDMQRDAEPDWVPQVSADGLQASASADNGQLVYQWSFTSTPGP